MTAPNRTKPASQNPTPTEEADRTLEQRQERSGEPQVALADDLVEIARTHEEVAQRARRVVADEMLSAPQNGRVDGERVERLRESARADLLDELRDQAQERARRQLTDAARSSEDAVAGVVQGLTTIVRGIVPAALVRPEDVIEATFALADQGIRVGRRLALTVVTSVRSLSVAA